MRRNGMLLPIASLPSPYGIGGFSKEAYEFIDLLEETGQKLWQILPLGPTSYGDSPYQSFSTFAGNPYFIDLDTLAEKGWLTKEACEASDYGDNESYIDYGRIYNSRFVLLKQAFLNSDILSDEKFTEFCKANQHWLPDYALYMALKNQNDGKSWIEWEEEIRLRKPEAVEYYKKELEEIDSGFREVSANRKRNMIVMGDKFPFRYLADEYQLDYRAAFSGCSSDTEPSAKTIAYLIDKVKEEQIPAVYYLELSSHRVAEIIGEETGAEPLLLHSCHNVTRAQFDAGITYAGLMRQNIENLRKGID